MCTHSPQSATTHALVEPGSVRVLLVDDHPVLRQGLLALLGVAEGIEVVGQAGDGQQAVELARTTAPDVVLMHLWGPWLDRLSARDGCRSLAGLGEGPH
jgi:DNA-binding NarL/FixJ family response regulator